MSAASTHLIARAPHPLAWLRAQPAAIATLIILAIAAIAQIHWGTIDDVSWLITVGERVLDGQTPYVDFIEVNPPASILLYLPPILLARFVGCSPELMVALFGFIGVAASLALCAAILARASLAEELGWTGLALAAFVFFLLPGHTFNQRDPIALVAGLPLLAAFAARASSKSVDRAHAALAGIGGGIMVSIKPHYGLIILATAPYLIWRLRRVVFTQWIELYVAAAVGVAYLTVVVVFFPAFLTKILPLATDVYLPDRMALADLLSRAGVRVWFALALLLTLLGRKRLGEPIVAIPALASCGALACFLVQGKGWPYQMYPALALMVLASGVALRRSIREPAIALLSLNVFGAAVALLMAFGYRLTAILAIMLFAVALGVVASIGRAAPALRGLSDRLEPLASATLAGLAFGFMAFSFDHAALSRALARLPPHPTMLEVSGNLTVGHPLVREVGGVWVQSVCSLWITTSAWRLIAGHPNDVPLALKLAPYLEMDRAMLIGDISRRRPDAILISNMGEDFTQWAWSDPGVSAALSDYRFFASDENPNPNYETKIYVRSDLIGLRPALTEPSSADGRDVDSQTQ
jgi:hypothetical protein